MSFTLGHALLFAAVLIAGMIIGTKMPGATKTVTLGLVA